MSNKSTGATTNDPYEPRRSNRVAADHTPADGDVWRERITVCEGMFENGMPNLVVRSYFRNERTQERVWDEPPSGASKIHFATADQRSKAQGQMRELQTTLDMIPPEEQQDSDGTVPVTPQPTNSNTKPKGFLGRWTKRSPKPAPQVNDAQDLNLQRAIAQSMAVNNSNNSMRTYNSKTPREFQHNGNDDDDDVALAKALSMSEAAATTHGSGTCVTEEDEIQLQQALEASLIEAEFSATQNLGSVARPIVVVEHTQMTEDLLGLNTIESAKASANGDDDDDRKMPALPQQPINPQQAAASASNTNHTLAPISTTDTSETVKQPRQRLGLFGRKAKLQDAAGLV